MSQQETPNLCPHLILASIACMLAISRLFSSAVPVWLIVAVFTFTIVILTVTLSIYIADRIFEDIP